ncbi:MAG TPA: endospore germination permease [Candidatus Atribacteria bacterium]|nr:endospore germination permease [Candidatus Atribacteria bacterium]HPT79442.1 endospore germination permease [Candidatus Atribacteria bacterium]
MKSRQGITNLQVTAIVSLSILGIAVLFIPSSASEAAGIDGVLATLFGGIVVLVLTFTAILLSCQYPNHTIIEYSQIVFGRLLGKLYGFYIVLYAIATTATVLRGFADAMKVLLLPKTPLEVIMITMMLTVAYQVQGGISTIARINELFLPPIIGLILGLLLLNVRDVEMFRYRALLSNGFGPILMSLAGISTGYLGFEIVTFLTPFVADKRKLLKYGMAGTGITIIIYTLLVFIELGIYGDKTIADMVYPTVHLARRILWVESFIERFDIFFLTFWILAAFTTITSYMYMAALSVVRIIGLRNYKPFVFILSPVVYMIAIIPQNSVQFTVLLKIISYAGLAIGFSTVPMLIISKIKKARINND